MPQTTSISRTLKKNTFSYFSRPIIIMSNKVILSTYNNGWYNSQIGAVRFKQLLWYFSNVLFFINPINSSSAIKVWLLRRFGAVIGRNVTIKPGVNIKYPWLLVIGDYCWIGEKVWIDNLAKVTIGSNVCLSQGAMLMTGNHNYKKISFDLIVKGIQLEDGVWIGARAVVCPGLICETHAVLTTSSVAVNNMKAYTIYQGNPAKEIRERLIDA